MVSVNHRKNDESEWRRALLNLSSLDSSHVPNNAVSETLKSVN